MPGSERSLAYSHAYSVLQQLVTLVLIGPVPLGGDAPAAKHAYFELHDDVMFPIDPSYPTRPQAPSPLHESLTSNVAVPNI